VQAGLIGLRQDVRQGGVFIAVYRRLLSQSARESEKEDMRLAVSKQGTAAPRHRRCRGASHGRGHAVSWVLAFLQLRGEMTLGAHPAVFRWSLEPSHPKRRARRAKQRREAIRRVLKVG
jgi:hypothetical protein